jgi:hypothetical protein
MMTTTTIHVNETVQNGITKVHAVRKDQKQIQIATFFKPYYDRGLKIKKLNYRTDTNVLKADLIAKS